MQQYLNIRGSTLTSLYSAPTFPDSPDRYSVNPSFQSEYPMRSVYCTSVCLSVYLCVLI